MLWNDRVDLPFLLPVNLSRKAGYIFIFKVRWFLLIEFMEFGDNDVSKGRGAIN